MWEEIVPKYWKGRRVIEASNGDLCVWRVGGNDNDEQHYCYEDALNGKCVSSIGGVEVCTYED